MLKALLPCSFGICSYLLLSNLVCTQSLTCPWVILGKRQLQWQEYELYIWSCLLCLYGAQGRLSLWLLPTVCNCSSQVAYKRGWTSSACALWREIILNENIFAKGILGRVRIESVHFYEGSTHLALLPSMSCRLLMCVYRRHRRPPCLQTAMKSVWLNPPFSIVSSLPPSSPWPKRFSWLMCRMKTHFFPFFSRALY